MRQKPPRSLLSGSGRRLIASQGPSGFQIRIIVQSMIDFQKVEDAQTLAQAIVNTIPEPFIVLDDRFHVLAASPSFYRTFKVDAEHTQGRLLYSLGDGQWDIPALRLLSGDDHSRACRHGRFRGRA